MTLKSITLTKAFLKNMIRQKTIIFSCFFLPVLTLWSTWWVTADLPMTFELANGETVNASMIDVHVLTGGLTAMAITAGLFSFIITAENQKVSSRLKLTGYSPSTINLGIFLSLFIVLVIASILTAYLTINLYWPEDVLGVFVSVFLVTIIYASFGNLMGNLYPKVMEGTLIVLLVSFIDLMLLSNPMGENLYLQSWTYYTPGFWPTQLVLETGFIGESSDIIRYVVLSLAYALILFVGGQVAKLDIRSRLKALRGVKNE